MTSGACLCGAVRFSAQMPAKWVAHCHCTRCQRAHGAAFVTWVGFSEASVALSSDDDALRWYLTEAGARRGFCGRCGSPMFFQSPDYPGECHIARAAFKTELDQLPTENVFFSSRVHWAEDVWTLPATPETRDPEGVQGDP